MIKFFRKIRQKLLSEGKTGKYLKYALGEIILVVIGILIALQINNWNENRKVQTELFDIYSQIIYELDNDITELSINLGTYETLKPVYDKVFSDSRTIELLDDGLSRLMAGGPRTNLNKSGIERLKTISANDSLSLKLIEIYDLLGETQLIPMEKVINDETQLLVNIFRDNYNWYPEWISKKVTKSNSSKDLQNYFVNSQEYRHYVISSYQVVYNYYVPFLKTKIPEMKSLRKKLQMKINK